MFFKFTGWLAVIVSLLAALFGVIPGVSALLALLISVFALFLTLTLRKCGHPRYFLWAAPIAAAGVLLLNSATSLFWAAGDPPWIFKIIAYGMVGILIALGWRPLPPPKIGGDLEQGEHDQAREKRS